MANLPENGPAVDTKRPRFISWKPEVGHSKLIGEAEKGALGFNDFDEFLTLGATRFVEDLDAIGIRYVHIVCSLIFWHVLPD